MRFVDPSQFDKAGSSWQLDKKSRKLRRIIEKVQKQGFYSKYDEGDEVYYDGGMNICKVKVAKVMEDGMYEIELDGNKFVVPEETLFVPEE
jgi:preprotein translocase subunit YajC